MSLRLHTSVLISRIQLSPPLDSASQHRHDVSHNPGNLAPSITASPLRFRSGRREEYQAIAMVASDGGRGGLLQQKRMHLTSVMLSTPSNPAFPTETSNQGCKFLLQRVWIDSGVAVTLVAPHLPERWFSLRRNVGHPLWTETTTRDMYLAYVLFEG